MKVLIDPGHGGMDAGAVAADGIREANIVLKVACIMNGVLNASGIICEMTREKDIYKNMQERCNIENQKNPDCFVSLHCNAFTDHLARGIEVWSAPGQMAADPLAEKVCDSLKTFFQGMLFRSDFSDRDADKKGRLYVLRHSLSPAILVEMGLISNVSECSWLKNINTQRLMALAIASGLIGWGMHRNSI